MLDLEKKTEKQLMDHKLQTADSIIQGFDIRSVRKEYQTLVEDSLDRIDLKFEEFIEKRVSPVEYEIQKMNKQISDFDKQSGVFEQKIIINDQNMKDTVELIKALDLRMVNTNSKQKDQINEIIKKIKDTDQNVLRELSKIDKSDGSFNINF